MSDLFTVFLGKSRMEWGMEYVGEKAKSVLSRKVPQRITMGQSAGGSLRHVGHSQTVLVIAYCCLQGDINSQALLFLQAPSEKAIPKA